MAAEMVILGQSMLRDAAAWMQAPAVGEETIGVRTFQIARQSALVPALLELRSPLLAIKVTRRVADAMAPKGRPMHVRVSVGKTAARQRVRQSVLPQPPLTPRVSRCIPHLTLPAARQRPAVEA